MKKNVFGLVLLLSVMGAGHPVSAQSQEIQQLLLDVEKLSQFKNILKDMKTGYRVVFTGYNTIKDISEGNFMLHKTFLDGLLQVSPAVRKYKKVPEIIRDQLRIIHEYRAAYSRFKRQDCFTPGELQYMGAVYGNLLNESLKDLDNLSMILAADKLRMSDEQRLSAIDRIYDDMEDKLSFLRDFDGKTGILALQRIKEKNDALTMEGVYDISH